MNKTTESASAVKAHRASLITITKRASMPFGRSVLIRVAAIFAALVVAGIVTIAMTGDSPIKIYSTMFEGAFGTSWATWKTLQDIAILLGISLAVTPAFRMKFWNTGAEGQVLIGCLACAATMFYLGGKVPEWLLMIFMAVASIGAGALWGLIPAIFKSFWNT
ncbi:MAG: ABC transporter permease, partial [Clostridia bacterium]|nr:ABC transporter permease [Clostridia bacterium]